MNLLYGRPLKIPHLYGKMSLFYREVQKKPLFMVLTVWIPYFFACIKKVNFTQLQHQFTIPFGGEVKFLVKNWQKRALLCGEVSRNTIFHDFGYMKPLFLCERRWVLFSCNMNLQFRFVVKWDFWSKIGKKLHFFMRKHPEMLLFMVLATWNSYFFCERI